MFEGCARIGVTALLLLTLNACGDDDDDMSAGAGAGAGAGDAGARDAGARDAGALADAGQRDGFDRQLPPTHSDDVERWLAARYFDDWTCEPEPTAKTDGAKAIHVHGGKSRVCS